MVGVSVKQQQSNNFYLSLEGKYSFIVEVSLNRTAFIKVFLLKHFYNSQVIAFLRIFVQFKCDSC